MTTPYPNSNPTPNPTPNRNRNPHPSPLSLHPSQASEGVLLGPHVRDEEERRRIVLEQRATRDMLEVRGRDMLRREGLRGVRDILADHYPYTQQEPKPEP